MTTRRFTYVVDAPSSGIPAWLDNATPGAWTDLPVATFGNLRDVLYSDAYAGTSGFPGNVYNVCQYSGASYDTDRNELLLACNGGDQDYWGNEVYALKLGPDVPSPYWYRLNNPTTASPAGGNVVGSLQVDSDGYAKFKDGRPRGHHTYGYPVYTGGRVWFPMQAFAYGGGATGFVPNTSTAGVTSINRAALRTSNTGTIVAAPAAGVVDVGAWTFHNVMPGFPPNATNLTVGYAALNGSGEIYAISGFSTAYVWKVNTGTGVPTLVSSSQTFATAPAWFVWDSGNGFFVRGGMSSSTVHTSADGVTWTARATTGAPTYTHPGPGATYQDGSIYVLSPPDTGGTIYALNTASWTWYPVAGSSATALTDSTGSGTYGRARVVKFGTKSAMVYQSYPTTNTKFCRIT